MRFESVAVVGLGYAGLPLALAFSEKLNCVYGIDLNQDKVRMLLDGHSYIDDVSDEEVKAALGKFHPTDDYNPISNCDAVVICVPTPLRKTGEPDISHVLNASQMVAKHVSHGTLVVLESTTYPGTTEEVLKPELESRGFVIGKDVFLAYSPERVDPGNKRWTLKNTPRIVGGVTSECTKRATALFSLVVGEERVITVSSPAVAEAAKLLENTFRAVNIALANEFALMCRRIGIDVWEVIEAASTKPFGFMPFYPGPGVGGHCIPVDPMYLAWRVRLHNFRSRFIELADEVNKRMPEETVNIIAEALNTRRKPLNGSSVLILGLTYKPNVSDYRESPSLEVIKLLIQRGAKVLFNDPYVSEIEVDGRTLKSQELTDELISSVDCVAVLTAHDSYNWHLIAQRANLIVDMRNVIPRDETIKHKVFRL
ncbi:MAG: nucleotide sugar dehydrogenase [Armatimonadota bacterium]|nr:nucleotide sugar dehydrogenase [Armatimonadota bacterium]MCX7776966.1 nucleotide sugar dehydrogenase [Armatimonadota bacterium]MDW8024800.1 nucleotide sugar dehydrogenase [Armatimonadota bacterium]